MLFTLLTKEKTIIRKEKPPSIKIPGGKYFKILYIRTLPANS